MSEPLSRRDMAEQNARAVADWDPYGTEASEDDSAPAAPIIAVGLASFALVVAALYLLLRIAEWLLR